MKVFFSLAAILGGLAVIIGAWGSHAGERLLTPEQLGLLHAFDIANPGYLTPVGGSVMILGWFVLAFGVWRG